MTQTYDPAAAQANNAARNQEIERAAMPTTKPLTKLADNPDHCKMVWLSVFPGAHGTIYVSISNETLCFSMSYAGELLILPDGTFKAKDTSESHNNNIAFNPFTLVSLLTQLGYAPTEP